MQGDDIMSMSYLDEWQNAIFNVKEYLAALNNKVTNFSTTNDILYNSHSIWAVKFVLCRMVSSDMENDSGDITSPYAVVNDVFIEFASRAENTKLEIWWDCARAIEELMEYVDL